MNLGCQRRNWDENHVPAEQLNHTDAEILYVVENVVRSGEAEFHFIKRSGTLYHLKSASNGMNILKSCMMPGCGRMDLILCSSITRVALYQVQKFKG